MYNLKGFVEVTALANNIPSNISPLGELSNISNSYSKEKGYYSKTDAPNVELISFTSETDGIKLQVPTKYHAHVLTLSQWIFSKAVEGALTDDAEAFRVLLLAQFEDTIASVIAGKMMTAKGNWMPSYVQWKLDDGVEENEIRIWFADTAFKAQYDDYEIIVIPPIRPVDIFQKVKSEVEPILSQFNLPDHHKQIAIDTGSEPYTALVTNPYMWHDREDSDATLMTYWSVVIYGIAGNNPLLIKDAIAKYILDNSAYEKIDWIPVFPDIFTSTEFILIPMWHKRSVPDETVRGQLYSPIVPYNEALGLAEKYAPSTVAGHVAEYLEISTVHYKSLAFLSSGGIENRDNIYRLSEMFPDYALIATTSADFDRIASDTTTWIMQIMSAIIAAEEMDEYSYLGVQLSRIVRDDFTYVGFSYKNVLYMVLSRGSMDEANEESEYVPI